MCESAGHMAVVLVAMLTPHGLDPQAALTECERDIMTLLVALHHPMPAEKIRDTLEARKIGTWGLRTVKRALKNLKDGLKLIGNNRRKRRGYYVIGRDMPLFRKAS